MRLINAELRAIHGGAWTGAEGRDKTAIKKIQSWHQLEKLN
jgi:hypothetical protein